MSTRKEILVQAFSMLPKELVMIRLEDDVVGGEKNNVLIIGDLHSPFTLPEYLPFCKKIYKKYKCNKVVFIGDLIDNHVTSYHETNPDGLNAGQELTLAINSIQKWHKAFPHAVVTIGNHDRLIMRQAQTAGISQHWIKDFAEVLGTPGWTFVDSIEIDGVLYTHGTIDAYTRAKRDLISVVSGHLHTKAGVQWFVGRHFAIFGLQVGCGIDRKAYAMAYAMDMAKPIISCGVVLDNGKLPIVILAEL